MYFLVSGEGVGDMGRGLAGGIGEGANFETGPMAIIVDQLTESFLGYELSHLDSELFGFVSERHLAENKLATNKKSPRLPGKKKPKETMYFYENARTLGVLAKEKSQQTGIPVIAVLFRDADGTASSGRGEWQHKRDSMLTGFQEAGFEHGVAMLPKPKSEAWLLCAVKQHPYQHCEQLENASGNDASPNSLKNQLSSALGGATSKDEINALLRDKTIDIAQISMPSFDSFKTDLQAAVNAASRISREQDGH